MRQTKRFAVVGSDARQAAAGRALARAGYTVGGVQQLPQADCILLPPRWNRLICRWRSCWARQSPVRWRWAVR